MDLTTQLLVKGDIREVNLISVAGSFLLGGKGGFVGSSVTGNFFEFSVNNGYNTNFNQSGSANFAVEALFGIANKKAGGLHESTRSVTRQSGRSMVETIGFAYAQLSKLIETAAKPQLENEK